MNTGSKIAALDAKLRTLSPCQFDVVFETVNTLINKLSEIREPEHT